MRRDVHEVNVAAFPLDRFLPHIGHDRFDHFTEVTSTARRRLGHRTIWNINSTDSGGGVAELLHVLLAYARGAGFDVRWMVIEGDPAFFRLTKNLHHLLHGNDPGFRPTEGDRAVYEKVAERNAGDLRALLRPGDIVVAHDPQTAPLLPELADSGVGLIWRCHVGADEENDATRAVWDFLAPYLSHAHAHVFSREEYVPPLLTDAAVNIVHPSIDPFSPKNEHLDTDTVEAVIACIGLVDLPEDEPARFVRSDGSPGRVDRTASIERGAGPVPPDVPLIVQVSRWDPLKDMTGVLRGFVDHVAPSSDAHLALVGPDVSGVSDDPEGQEVLDECTAMLRGLPAHLAGRVHLVSLPMDDLEENAVMVNAVQRYAHAVVQKSIAEGFGLTVTEAMWKARPVVASAVGGIVDQVTHGEHGFLVADANDLREFGEAVHGLLADPERAQRMGTAARDRVADAFLSTRHLEQYVAYTAEVADALG